MEGLLQEVVETTKSVANKISPALNWISEKAGGFVDISPTNIHQLLLFGIGLWISSFITHERGIKFWIIGIAIFLGFRYVGL